VYWKSLDDQLIPLSIICQVGYQGNQVDFMQRDDQLLINFSIKFAAKPPSAKCSSIFTADKTNHHDARGPT